MHGYVTIGFHGPTGRKDIENCFWKIEWIKWPLEIYHGWIITWMYDIHSSYLAAPGIIIYFLNIQLKASTFFIISHSVHPIHVHHPIVSLNIFLILITIIDTHSFTDYLDFGMPSLLLIYIYLSPPSKSNSKNTFGIILYQTLIMKIHVLFIYYVHVTSAIIFLLL